jgi:gliding motility-associated-like protein
MILKTAILKVIACLIGTCCVSFALFSQHVSRENYTGPWESPASWNPEWPVPLHIINGFSIIINGYITVNGSLSFTGNPTNLLVNDTLVIKGNLVLDNNSDVTVGDNGILIIRGNLTIDNQTTITANGYIVVNGNVIKNGSVNQGFFTSNDNPVKVFIGGNVSNTGITDGNPNYPALNCSDPETIPYPNSSCSSGNLTDLANDPLFDFFRTTCIINTPTITAGGPTSFCEGGTVTLTSSSGPGYQWSTGETSSGITVSQGGSYTVQLKNGSGCISASSVASIVTVNPLPATPVITSNGPAVLCEGDSRILTSSPESGYLWSTGATTSYIHVTTGGIYSVRVTNANGCQSAASKPDTLTVNQLPGVYAGANTTIPYGTSTTIDAVITGTGPFNYDWTPSEKLVNGHVEDPVTVNLTSTTMYALTVTSEIASCSKSDSVTITVSGGPLSTAPVVNPSSVCAGEQVQLYALASGGSGTYTYSWSSVPAGFTSSTDNPVVVPDVNTTYHLEVSDGFTTANADVTVTVNAVPVKPAIDTGSATTFCEGDSVILTTGPGISYEWSNGATTSGITVRTTGSYSVIVTDASGCQSVASDPILVNVNPVPVTPTITAGGPTTFCDDSHVTLTASEGTKYGWSNGETTPGILVSQGGNYSVRTISAAGCQSAPSVPTIVTVNASPAIPSILASGPLAFCPGESVSLTASSGTDFNWSTGETTSTIRVTAAGTYTVQVADATGCKSAVSVPAVVEIKAPFQVTITNDGIMCLGDPKTLSGNPSGGTFAVIEGPGSISENILSATGTGNILITYRLPDACSVADTMFMAVMEKPIANAGPDQDLKFTFETALNAELLPAQTGTWSLLSGSGNIEDVHSPVTRISGLSSGENIFLWSVSNASCEASATVRIVVEDLFIPSVITPNGDGKNDYFIINADNSRLSLIIFNSWGIEEYKNDNYLNNWDGRNNQGEALPGDTYFYILKFASGLIKKGTVLIVR